MADLHHAFGKYHARIALTSGNRSILSMAREAVRQRIRRYFRDILGIPVPKFRGHGAYAMGTLVNPIDGPFEIDDAVYLRHLTDRDKDCWPPADMIYQTLAEAFNRRDAGQASVMQACVRVRFGNLYRVDLPCYARLGERYMLAARGDFHWPPGDPSALTGWFARQVRLHGEQLRRIVRFVKAWGDFQSHENGAMPGGLILTVLAACHYQCHARDDVALAYTLGVMASALDTACFVPNPEDLREELTERLSDARKTRFRFALKAAAEDARRAITMESSRMAAKLWRKQLGERFPTVL